ncbi:unnamed protein product [Spirodela intermedia]|uniref:Uncharacterized protein n=1 Tax=Spirodela intermedia TaxID=51605 RepID=A0A7I8IF77_SPIIN|nr:unnamed protein product [Spirodela intermedia]CAA6656447.1 unnamed protein product [Spirodela intermedia]
MLHSFHAPAGPSIFSPRRRRAPASSLPRLRAISLTVCRTTASSKGPSEFETLKCQLGSEDMIEGGSPVVEESGGGGPPPQVGEEDDANVDDGKQGISGIYVPRQKYIPISKEDLLSGILSMFESEKDADDFRRFAKCLDLTLHAEHKGVLEEMRTHYSLMHTEDKKENIASFGRSKTFLSNPEFFSKDVHAKGVNGKSTENSAKLESFYNDFDVKSLFGSSSASRTKTEKASSVIPTHFQHTFMKLLRNAQFEELSAEDLLLTYALNTDYLLTLPIYVDWKKASESNAIIFRRGYATERQKGFLIIEKLDYLQSRLLQKILFNISRPVKRLSIWINEALKNPSQTDELKGLIERAKGWLEKHGFPKAVHSHFEATFTDQLEYSQPEASELPIWLASQRASLRYQGFLSSIGPLSYIKIVVGRPNFLPRMTLTDIWEPASMEACGSNIWKMLKTGVSIIFSRSVLQEPAFQELILLYTEEVVQSDSEKSEARPLQLKIYERIPYPELPVVFPHKKLSFRILDTVRLDVASILGLLAYFVNYKFENILSSPSAFFLDVVAISALVLFMTRVGLLLVNRTLYEKTLASGFGSVHFLLDASEQQQYKEAVLAYAILLRTENLQVSCRKSLADACEIFLYDKFHEKVEMPIENAINTLLRLDIVKETQTNGSVGLNALPSLKAYKALKSRWDDLI